MFAMPEQLGRVYLGLTDEEAPGPIPDVPEPSPEEITFLLDTVNTALQTTLTPADVAGAYAGLRPLIDAGEEGPGSFAGARRAGVRLRVIQHRRRQTHRVPAHGRGCPRSCGGGPRSRWDAVPHP